MGDGARVSMKTELSRRLSFSKQLEVYLKAHPNEWIPIATLAKLGGIGGWRTRLSELGKREKDPLALEYNGKPGELAAHRYLPNGPRLGRASTTPDLKAVKRPLRQLPLLETRG